ncbi:STIV orfB116 family protein [Vulcanisaeta souniana]|uniref:DUF1874 domain-containing protein n=1 Tax=Vulcanisaeta souniana JCM 11219 TaxID=1293586 RepID=A0A830EKN2_9CREN|nr:DUF1874 domain-containing protein [Vulcanisaeta souniana]BDR92258.1 hypothetical protein Vsou_13510 [Vulcanisaeta souniana JCM 11219]GGI86305.1 hypothetical protein GCM10007112_24090 [Vulcanisaeta souniana JCM 11219]
MTEILLLNALPLNAISQGEVVIKARRISPEEARRIIEGKQLRSFIGHEATANALSILLGVNVPTNRANATLTKGSEALIIVLVQRLPEGQVIRSVEEVLRFFQLWHVKVE